MKEVRWGIIAAGGIANAFAHSIQYSKNSKLCCVLGRTEEKVNSFAEKHNCLPYFDLETFLISEIDAVYIAYSSRFSFLLFNGSDKKKITCFM
jgi:predicted dehydrogenase